MQERSLASRARHKNRMYASRCSAEAMAGGAWDHRRGVVPVPSAHPCPLSKSQEVRSSTALMKTQNTPAHTQPPQGELLALLESTRSWHMLWYAPLPQTHPNPHRSCCEQKLLLLRTNLSWVLPELRENPY